jgi:hypothetical protein
MNAWMKMIATSFAAVAMASCALAQGGPDRAGPPAGRGMAERWGPDRTPGWAMMSPEERAEHRRQMESVRTRDECRKTMDDHHRRMVERAKERGMMMPDRPRHDACANMDR